MCDIYLKLKERKWQKIKYKFIARKQKRPSGRFLAVAIFISVLR